MFTLKLIFCGFIKLADDHTSCYLIAEQLWKACFIVAASLLKVGLLKIDLGQREAHEPEFCVLSY